MSTSLQQLVIDFFNELEVIEKSHEEVSDTEVRETLHDTLNLFFIWGQVPLRVPAQFGLFSAEANQRVRDAVARFLEKAPRQADVEGVQTGQPRLDVLQSDDVVTRGGQSSDSFIGFVDEPLPPQPIADYWYQPFKAD